MKNDRIGQIIYNKIIDKAEKHEKNNTIWTPKISSPDQTLLELFFVSKTILYINQSLLDYYNISHSSFMNFNLKDCKMLFRISIDGSNLILTQGNYSLDFKMLLALNI